MNQLPEHIISDRFARHVGIEPWWDPEREAWSARLRPAEHHLNGMGVVQGGALFTLADFAFAIACNSDGRVSVAVQASISFLAPASVETGYIYARIREISRRRTVSVYEISLRDEGGNRICQFSGTALRLNR